MAIAPSATASSGRPRSELTTTCASATFYTRQLDELAQTTAQACNCLALEDPELGSRLARIRQDLGLDVLNLVDDRGTPVAGAFEDEPQPVALGLDPVLSAAKRGTLAFGTVTLFCDGVRIATNVRAADGRRAIGTRVSPAVAKTVQEGGRRWTDRAKVVDAWYLSAYEPLRDPAGRIVGMLYVGLLEAPYDKLKQELVLNFGLGLGLMLLISLLVAVVLIHKAVRPIKQLSAAAVHMSHGKFDQAIAAGNSYTEFNHLIEMFQQMQEAIGLRDKRLKEHNQQLAERNEEVQQANRSYLEMLAFVTHELKSPLVAIQTLINTLVEGYLGEVPEPMAKPLSRIQHRCEKLQDMVKNYLDLSRYERGELHATKVSFDFRAEVVDACGARPRGARKAAASACFW
ncbi:MAG: cache domain-containing protein [Deltaproteobacteria bacterium]|nr:cache domain-containing protein [Deltaproteobacteria bacterium]